MKGVRPTPQTVGGGRQDSGYWLGVWHRASEFVNVFRSSFEAIAAADGIIDAHVSRDSADHPGVSGPYVTAPMLESFETDPETEDR
jgi:hypothetical protein